MSRIAPVWLVVVLLACPAWAQVPAAPAPAPAPPPQVGTPLTLDQALATALCSNPSLQAAQEGVRISQDLLSGARATKGPSFDLGVTYTRVSRVASLTTFLPDPDTGDFTLQTIELGKEENTNAVGILSMPVFTSGALSAGIRAAREGVIASRQSLTRNQQQVTYGVRQTYYGVLTALDAVAVAQQALAAAEEQLRVARAFLAAGTAPQFDVLRAEARVAQARQGLTAVQNGEQTARAALNNILGVPQEMAFNLVTPLRREPSAQNLEQLQQAALQARPDLLQAQANQRALRETIVIARAVRRPSLGVSWSLSHPVTTTTFAVGGWTLALALQQNLFDSGRARAQVREARDRLAQVRALTEQLRQNVTFEVKEAYLNANTAQQQIASAAAELVAANEALRIAQVRYQAGVSTPVEVIDAQVARESAANSYNGALYNYNLALAQLDLALGAAVVPTAQPIVCPPRKES